MSIATVKRVAKEAVSAASISGVKISATEAKKIVAEASKGTITVGEKKVIADLFDSANLSAAAKATFTKFLGAKPADLNLGEIIGAPGPALADKTFALKPGQSMVFETSGNQIGNCGFESLGLSVKTEVLERSQALGGAWKFRHTLTVPTDARAGSTIDIKSTPTFQARNNPDWTFGFKVKVG